uniref:Uncharacterized protein n=1 Tax=Triticum urartu TaxID=4572 RepID=A0A8R7UT47_TRIUA
MSVAHGQRMVAVLGEDDAVEGAVAQDGVVVSGRPRIRRGRREKPSPWRAPRRRMPSSLPGGRASGEVGGRSRRRGGRCDSLKPPSFGSPPFAVVSCSPPKGPASPASPARQRPQPPARVGVDPALAPLACLISCAWTQASSRPSSRPSLRRATPWFGRPSSNPATKRESGGVVSSGRGMELRVDKW